MICGLGLPQLRGSDPTDHLVPGWATSCYEGLAAVVCVLHRSVFMDCTAHTRAVRVFFFLIVVR